MKRTRVPVYLMLCTLEDEEGRQVQSETKMNKYSRQLKKCVGESIRYSDIYTSYGKVQFLIMLIGIKREDCEIVSCKGNSTNWLEKMQGAVTQLRLELI